MGKRVERLLRAREVNEIAARRVGNELLTALHVEKSYPMYSLLHTLKEASSSRKWDTCKSTLHTMRRRISEVLTPDQAAKNQEGLIMCGGIELLVSILLSPLEQHGTPSRVSSLKASESSSRSQAKDFASMKIDLLGILREICYAKATVAENLSWNTTLLIDLFDKFIRPKDRPLPSHGTFECGVQLAEEILSARQDALSLESIPNFPSLVSSLSPSQLPMFCRLISLLLYMPDERSSENHSRRTSLTLTHTQQLQKEKDDRNAEIMDLNHGILIDRCPIFLPRLIKLLSVPLPTLSTPLHLSESSLTSAEFISLFMGLELSNDWDDLGCSDEQEGSGNVRTSEALGPARRRLAQAAREGLAALLSLEVVALADGNPTLQRPVTTINNDAPQVEILFVLCMLLNGKRKKEVQDRVGALGLIKQLNSMFSRIDWSISKPENNHDSCKHTTERVHGNLCECSPASALKTQFLRVIHVFCDRDADNMANKRLLLSASELRSVLGDDAPNDDSSTPTDAAPGLMSKIIGRLCVEPLDSPYRFWLASCVEDYLRGSHPADQIFIAKNNDLMKHLVDEIVEHGLKVSEGTLQTNFDLLGEMVKFNLEAVVLLDSLLSSSEDRFERFMNVAVSYLVDSNVLIRCLLLSFEFFQNSDPTNVQWPFFDRRNTCTPSEPLSWKTNDPSSLPPANSSNPAKSSACPEATHQAFPIVRAALSLLGSCSSSSDPTSSSSSSSCAGVDDMCIPPSASPSLYTSPALDPPVDPSSTSRLMALAQKTKVASFLECNAVRLLKDLMTVVSVESIDQDSLCCLNTAILFFIFAEKRANVSTYIQAICDMETDNQVDRKASYHRSSLRNFHDLLGFWKDYYVVRQKDSMSLEYSTRIRFDVYRSTVDSLCKNALSPEEHIRVPFNPTYEAASTLFDRSNVTLTA